MNLGRRFDDDEFRTSYKTDRRRENSDSIVLRNKARRTQKAEKCVWLLD